jgi:hypothetical protein
MIPALEIPIIGAAQFRGRVIPEIAKVTVGLPHTVRWKHDTTSAVAELCFAINESQVTVDVTTDGAFHLGDLYRRALDLTQAMVDILGFAKGISLVVIFDTVAHDGNEAPVAICWPDVAKFCTAYSVEADFAEILKLVIEEPPLFVALNDLNTAMTHHHLSPVNFARAVEAIRVMIAGADTGLASWVKMRETLRVDEAYLKLITSTSAPKRHCDHKRVEGDTVATVSERAWRVMDRFIAYRRRGSTPLPENEFPMLVG